ncbi:MAG: hypothetical protein ACD_74C00099G0002 [uncultured bacterium]|nr:MAG: hypothetical protein ACD_74C00099G0002 [uncultured bacterium]
MYNYPVMPGAGFFSLMMILAIIGGIMMFLLPFFVYRIRKEVIEINRKFDRIFYCIEREYHSKQEKDPLSMKIK